MSENTLNYVPVSLVKRLMAIFYDSLLLLALLFVVGIIFASIFTFAINDGHAITNTHPIYPFYQAFILTILLVTAYLFFGWFWIHGGQTLGMKTWRLQLKTTSGEQINWQIAAVRYVAALFSWSLFGLGFLWSLVDARKRCWHDILSSTILIQLEKK